MALLGLRKSESDSQWLPVSDLMAGLMVIFLFIAISYIKDAIQEKEAVEEIVLVWRDAQIAIYDALNEEFEQDFPKWNAELEKNTLIIRFKNPEILFEQGAVGLSNEFKNILSDFCPRYLDVLIDFRKSIDEVRIEGHTSSEWNDAVAESDTAYFRNMALSQGRTRSVLQFCLSLDYQQKNWLKDWARTHITANGLSSSRLVYDSVNIEDKRKSRRVEFRVQTKAKERIQKILDTLDKKK